MDILIMIISILSAFFIALWLRVSILDTLMLMFFAPLGVLLLKQIFSDTLSESNTVKSFLKNLSLNVVGMIIGIAVIIGGLWIFAKTANVILNAISVNVLALVILVFFIYLFIKKPPPPHVRDKWIEDIQEGIHETSVARKEEEIKTVMREIEDLERERNGIETGYGIFLPNGLSDSEREHNIRRRNELDSQIQDKEGELRDKQRELDNMRR